MNIKFRKLVPNAIPFKYSREGDACMDMYASEDYVVYSNTTMIIPTGIAVEIPEGYEGLIRGRSGLASRGIWVHNGTIDCNYRGDVGVIITNNSFNTLFIEEGMRIAQFTIKPVIQITLEEVDNLSNTNRGEQGYGSSGI